MKEKTTKRSRISATVCMGLALFATQFGAGNLIFPRSSEETPDPAGLSDSSDSSSWM